MDSGSRGLIAVFLNSKDVLGQAGLRVDPCRDNADAQFIQYEGNVIEKPDPVLRKYLNEGKRVQRLIVDLDEDIEQVMDRAFLPGWLYSFFMQDNVPKACSKVLLTPIPPDVFPVRD
jgi:hypothetical protein